MNSDKMELARMAFLQLSKNERGEFLRTFGEPAPTATDSPRVYRFGAAARSLSITPRALSYAMQSGGIQPVRLPGRSRAFGIRAADLDRLANGEG